MKFGWDFFPDRGPNTKPADQYFKEALDLTEQADQLGFHSVKMVEHYCYAYGGYSPSPLAFLAACAMRTKNMRLVTGCVLPAFTHPVKLAAECAMVDAISGGRLEVGFARAFIPGEFAAFGIPMDESRIRFEEAIEAIKRLWTQEKATFNGKIYSFENVTSLPLPVQKPHPPIWIAVVATAASYEWAGKMGYNLMVVPYLGEYAELKEHMELYRHAYESNGHGKVTPDNFMMVLHTYVADSQEEAYAVAKPATESYISVFKEAAASWNTTSSKDYQKYNALPQMLDAMTFEKVAREKRGAFGTPDQVYEIIKELSDYFGCGHLTLQMFFGGITYEQSKRSMEKFAAEVMPRFSK